MPKNNEEQNQRFISTIAEITIFSIPRHDMGTVYKGITTLEKIAIDFLQFRVKSPEKFQIMDRPIFSRNAKTQNQYISYIGDELFHIFKVAINNRDTYASKQIIKTYHKILSIALEQPDNEFVLRTLFEFRERYGSLYWQLLDFAIDYHAKFEITMLLQTLSEIPNLFFIYGKYRFEYVEEFINIHIFRIIQLIIDKNDFESFKGILDSFSTCLHFTKDYSIHNDLLYDLFEQNSNDEIYKQLQKLEFILSIEFKKNQMLVNIKQQRFGRLIDELDILGNLLIKNGDDKCVVEEKKEKFLEEFIKLYIQELIYSTFFVTGAYLLYKGTKYSKWLSEIWYYTNPEYSNTTHINQLPIIRDPLFEICFAMYEGINSRLGIQIQFGNYSDAGPYLYQYAMLSMLRDNNCITFPTEDMIKNWHKTEQIESIMFWYEIIESLRIKDLTEAMNRLKPEFTHSIRGMDTEIIQRMKTLDQNLKKLEESKLLIKEKLALAIDVSPGLICNQIKKIKDFYKNKSMISSLSNTCKNSVGKFKKINNYIEIPRDSFIEQTFMGYSNEMGDLGIADKEKYYLHVFLSKQLKKQKLKLNLKKLTTIIQDMKNNGYHPNIIFIPLDLIRKLDKKQDKWYSLQGNIEIDGETLRIIHSWNKWPFVNTIIYDKNYLKVTYKDEIAIKVCDTDKKVIRFDAFIDMKIEILEQKAFMHIS